MQNGQASNTEARSEYEGLPDETLEPDSNNPPNHRPDFMKNRLAENMPITSINTKKSYLIGV